MPPPLPPTPGAGAEALRRGAQLAVTHHPVLFRPVQRITSETAEGRVLLALIQAGVAGYRAHTAYDGARDGINQQLAERFDLRNIAPLRPCSPPAVDEATEQSAELLGSGSVACLPHLRSLVKVLRRGRGAV